MATYLLPIHTPYARTIRRRYRTWWERRINPDTAGYPIDDQTEQKRFIREVTFDFEITTYEAAQAGYATWTRREIWDDPILFVGNPPEGERREVTHFGSWTMTGTDATDLGNGKTRVQAMLVTGNTEDEWETA